MSGLTLGLMNLSLVDLEILAKAGQPKDKENAAKILPLVKNQHLLLCTILIINAMAMEVRLRTDIGIRPQLLLITILQYLHVTTLPILRSPIAQWNRSTFVRPTLYNSPDERPVRSPGVYFENSPSQSPASRKLYEAVHIPRVGEGSAGLLDLYTKR